MTDAGIAEIDETSEHVVLGVYKGVLGSRIGMDGHGFRPGRKPGEQDAEDVFGTRIEGLTWGSSAQTG